MRQLVPPLIVGAKIATAATWVGLLTGMDTVFLVGAVIATLCLAATAGINFRFELQRARREREYLDCPCTAVSLHYLQQVGAW